MKATAKSTAADGTLSEITLEKTGPNKGKVRLVSWAPGAPKANPSSEKAVDISDVRATADETKLTCRVNVPFLPDPKLELVLKGAVVSVTITGLGAGKTDYPVDPVEAATVSKFIVDCKFLAL